ncbi:MAG: CdaR family protein [Peptoniphilaceae bacterium]|nr:CdaR family protein [Peptoniphilaceae bacterium]MDY6085384.1 CdaR family protein [Peptoniphilaceae bacterium]
MRILKNNWKWKLASLIIAILLWSYITIGINPTQSLTLSDVPVTFANAEHLSQNDYQVTKQEFDTISVQLVGKRNELVGLSRDSVRATVDASVLSEGTQRASIHVTAPSPLMVSDISYTQMEVTVEKIVTESRPVHIEQRGKLPEQYVLRDLVATPETMEVTGPRSAVAAVNRIAVDIDVSNMTEDTSANVETRPVDAKDVLVKDVRLSLASVNVTASVSMQKEVPIRLETHGETAANVRIDEMTIAPNRVLIMGKPAEIENVKEIRTQPLDLAAIQKEGTVPVTLAFPDGIEPVSASLTVNAQITLVKPEQKTFTIPVADIELKNLLGRKVTPVETKEVQVTLEGFPAELDAVTPANLDIFIEVPEPTMRPQNRTLPIRVNPPKGVTFIKAEPASLEMSIGPEPVSFERRIAIKPVW